MFSLGDVDPHLAKSSFEELADILANAAIAIHWVGANGEILWANAAELSLLGYRAEEYIGRHIGEFHADTLVIGDILKRLTLGETLDGYEARLKAKDGSIRHVLITSNVVRKNGEFVHTRCFSRDITERKLVEIELRSTKEALQATVQQLQTILHQMPSAVAVVEAPSGKVILANAKNEQIFRQPNVPTDRISEYQRFRGQHADGREMAPTEWPLSRSILSGEVVEREDIHIIRGDGTEGHIRVNSSPIRDPEGRIIAGVVTYDDVTEEKEALLELREQGRVNETLLRIGMGLSSELNLDVLMQKLTDEATTLCRAQFGAFFYNVTDDRGESFMLYTISGVPREAFSKFPMPRNTAIFEPTFSGTGVRRIDDVTQHADYGKSAPYHGMPEGHLPVRSYLAVPVKSRSGEVLGGLFFGHEKVGVFSAEDERLLVAAASQAAIAIDNARLYQAARFAEAAAGSERSRLRHLFMQAPALISIQRGPDHIFEFVNVAAERLFAGRDVLGKPLREAFSDVSEELITILDGVYKTGERRLGTEVMWVLDGANANRPEERFFNFVYEPYRDVDAAIAGVMSFGFEVTDQVNARRKVEAIVKELEVAARAKDEFLATVSHELRTPLNAMLGWVRMLRSGTLPEDRRERALETIERNANAQTQLIEDLLDVSRIISGKLRLEVGSVDLPQVVDGAIEAVRPAADAKGIALHQTMDPLAGPVLGDSDRLQQTVWNLLSNAVKFTPKGGKIQVAVRKRDSFVEIVVRDNGQGVDPAFLPHMFERFRQADASTSRTHGGLGLGLSIVRHLVELHGGTVSVASEGLGKGATFTVTLPISPLRSTVFEQPRALRFVSPTSELHCPPQLDGVHVLVLDDEVDARDLLVQVLTPCNARVTTAASVAEAIEIVQNLRPDVIVSDIGMPGEDGYLFIKKVRELPMDRGGRTPAVALTAYARLEDRTKALISGFNMHIPKPVEPAELLIVLASLTTLFPRR